MNAMWFSFQCKPTHINYCAKSWPFKRLAEMINGSCKLFRVVTRCENILRALPHRANEISSACVCFMFAVCLLKSLLLCCFCSLAAESVHKCLAFFVAVCRVDLVACLITHRHTHTHMYQQLRAALAFTRIFKRKFMFYIHSHFFSLRTEKEEELLNLSVCILFFRRVFHIHVCNNDDLVSAFKFISYINKIHVCDSLHFFVSKFILDH